MIGWVIIVVLVLLWVLRRNSARLKGSAGEIRVARRLARLDPTEYRVLNRLLIVNGDMSSQIDHVVVSRFGIFVIETKNYKGWICGAETSEYWTQYTSRRVVEFRNPIKQNRSHICVLQKVLPEYGTDIYRPIVVFAGRAELYKVFSSLPVVYCRNLLRTIRGYEGAACLSARQVESIVQKLTGINRQDRTAKKEHVCRVRSQMEERRRMEQAGICPWCGAPVILKQGPYGWFYGCSNYPACRYRRHS